MYLKRLELSGFKSFAVKNILEFPRGISVIVGPNGSGKSNLADAIRWALGEQSMKSIRTGKSDELIFAGTPQKTAANLAQVAVYFDNSDKVLAAEPAEITISRKLYKNGESEYFLNREPARLKDIVSFLARARLGVRGFCVISQGAADSLLVASSKEKKEMIEEALGLKEFQLKKHEARRKIDETKINLDKVSSMLQEIAPHLRYLKRQVNKFEKRQPLENELKELQKSYFSRELQKFLEEWRDVTEDKTSVWKKFKDQKEDLERMEESFRKSARTPRYFQEFEAIEEKINRLREEKSGILREFGKIEGLIEAEKRRPTPSPAVRIIPMDGQRLLKELREVREILQELLLYDSLDSLKAKIREIDTRLHLIINPETPAEEPQPASVQSDELAGLEFKKSELNQAVGTINSEIEALNASFQELRERNKKDMEESSALALNLEKQKNELALTENSFRALEISEAKFQIREEDLKTKIREAQLAYEEIEELSRNSQNGTFSAAPAALEEKIFKIKRELGEIGAIDEDLLREYRETNERHEFLNNQSTDLQGAISSLDALIFELEEKINTEFDQALIKINEAFSRYFQLMFGGGGAKLLKITAPRVAPGETPAAPEETAVPEELEIKVDLPRKKIKSLDMLSGGERALTSIALLFGIITTSPPPFLILDEIDAALDEANSLKFARMLKELSRETQFILITHNRQTMSEAHVLYGVTMANDGVSRLLSLKLEEAEEIGRQYKEKS